MKIVSLVSLLVFAYSAQAQKIDTVQTFSYGKMPPVYFSNKVYWERNYDMDNHLEFEALKYNSCYIGDFINYWKSGGIKTKGQYRQDTTGDLVNLREHGLCSMKEGEWKAYTEDGKLQNTFLYKNDIIIKEY